MRKQETFMQIISRVKILLLLVTTTLLGLNHIAYGTTSELDHQGHHDISISQAELDRINNGGLFNERATSYRQQAKVMAIDTSDRIKCEEIARQLQQQKNVVNFDLDSFCEYDQEAPTRLVIIQTPEDKLFQRTLVDRDFSAREQRLLDRSQGFVALGVGMMGLLYLLPESTTNWNKEELRLSSLSENYRNNVSEGPVWDDDAPGINWIGHSYAGSVYYVVARKANFSPLESFGYAAFMSTFFWEYGLEALAETPSKQDLLITPILGSLLGEVFYQLSLKIEENDGELAGSRLLGSTVQVIADPGTPLLNMLNDFTGTKTFHSVESSYIAGSVNDMYDYVYGGSSHYYQDSNSSDDSYFGLHIKLNF